MTKNHTDGLLSLMGSFSVHVALLVTMLLTVKVPLDEFGKFDQRSLNIYNLLCVTHIVLALVTIMSYWITFKVVKPAFNALSLILYIYSLVAIYQYLEEKKSQESNGLKDKLTLDELSQGEQKKDYVLEFKFWMYVECLLFIGTLTSNLVFILLKQCSKSQLLINSNNRQLVEPKQ